MDRRFFCGWGKSIILQLTINYTGWQKIFFGNKKRLVNKNYHKKMDIPQQNRPIISYVFWCVESKFGKIKFCRVITGISPYRDFM